MRVTTKKEEGGFVPTSFSVTVESYEELNLLWAALYDSNDPFIEDFFNEVAARCKEVDGK